MATDRKKRRGRTFRLVLLGIILVLLLLLLMGDRWGVGPGDILRLTSPAPAQEAPDRSGDQDSRYREVVIRISETTIQVDENTHTLESLETYLNEADAETVYVLEDQQANYALFTRIEGMLQERELLYVIED
ncbi:MAG: hypothetical protein SCK57_08990 [Bacillota bacterium]|nr:hypothetical protein [Bacillota bacterium]MDW7677782.1 hypothetical protein [Bacillota bacterium]